MRLLPTIFLATLLAGCASTVVPLSQSRAKLATHASNDDATLRARWGDFSHLDGKHYWPDLIKAGPFTLYWILPGAILELEEFSRPGVTSTQTLRYKPEDGSFDVFNHSDEQVGTAHVNRDGSVTFDISGYANYTYKLAADGSMMIINVVGSKSFWRDLPKAEWLSRLEVIEDDRRAERLRSSRETNDTITAMAQGLLMAAATATPSPSVSSNTTPPTWQGGSSSSSPASTSPGGSGVASRAAASPVPGKPVRFMLLIGFTPNANWKSNRHCYSNVVEGPAGPPGWGTPKLESNKPGRAIVERYFAQFLAKCRAIAAVDSDRPQMFWNETSDQQFERDVREWQSRSANVQGAFGRVSISP
jgi:hypothetical protein